MSTDARNRNGRRGTTECLPPHVIALIRERQRRIAALPRYDRYIAQAVGHLTLQGFWRNLRRQDEDDIQRIKNWLDWEAASDRVTSDDHRDRPGPDSRVRGGEPCRDIPE
jgi:hypothetical protein